ncbi:uncharacterized protein [Bos mutus]|uniref:uncharacterized protein n=1 Tax=Bos mutus TaxID=72004 RepID=UPI0038B50925
MSVETPRNRRDPVYVGESWVGESTHFLGLQSPGFLHKVRLGGLPENERGKTRKRLTALSERPFGKEFLEKGTVKSRKAERAVERDTEKEEEGGRKRRRGRKKSRKTEREEGRGEREKERKKHGACELYVQNPQGIAVNSFLFEENLQLGNRPFYDLFAVVIGCGWSCAGSARLHGLFPDFPGEFPPAFCLPRASPPLFLTFVFAEVGSSRRLRDCGVRGGLGSCPAPNLAPRPLRPGPRRCRLRSRRGARRAGEPGRSPGRPGPHWRRHRPPGAAGLQPGGRDARFRRGSFSNMSGSQPRRARVTGQRLVDYSRRRGRPPPPALHLRFGTVRHHCLHQPQPRAAPCLQAAPASGW